MNPTFIKVCAAVIRDNGKILLASRDIDLGTGKVERYWEFPGGKIHDGESHADCMRRELLEEIGADVQVFDLMMQTVHSYPIRNVHLYFYRCMFRERNPKLHCLDGQELRWVKTSEILQMNLLPADKPMAEFLGL